MSEETVRTREEHNVALEAAIKRTKNGEGVVVNDVASFIDGLDAEG